MKLKKGKEVVSPKGLKPKKPWNTSPKAHEGKRKKRKEIQIGKWKKNQCKRAESGSPETTKGSLRYIAKLRQDQDSLKENTKKTLETKSRYVLFRYQKSNKKKREKPRVTAHNAQGTVLRGTRTRSYEKKEVAVKNFRTPELDSAHPGKMTKRTDDQKVNHKERDIKRTSE